MELLVLDRTLNRYTKDQHSRHPKDSLWEMEGHKERWLIVHFDSAIVIVIAASL